MGKENKKHKADKLSFGDFLEGFFYIGDIIRAIFVTIPRAIGWIFRIIFRLFD
ncbi:hypothetical protein MXE81_01865 [Mammaliicoccus sciuri]|mgnify:FL=1|uniref:hypothetical protein n=1 Tax=Bacillota TaxID=1239 RepID=UPI000AB01996|nr:MULTISPECIES: hypothetical protein [Bacillota]MBO1218254.1 hypothetical protein [Mammaliicoccus sciuri]MBO1231769.1 hypothetical protein [Mammaliicoccus sciuri]MBO3080271.1 hypothetical protein [Mammaliicoccus sciuri]MBV5103946.1 hypothetical protein [Mammaliicoccus sciuri]MCD8777153.1 hypothetical protein [Mammaliicoccus sciuri]